jgi:hypothetical protein
MNPKGGTGKWAPKLTFEERCGFYYAYTIGVSKETIAAASGLNRGTVTRLINPRYRAYAEVHRKYGELGADAFREAYYPPALAARLAQAQVGLCTSGV